MDQPRASKLFKWCFLRWERYRFLIVYLQNIWIENFWIVISFVYNSKNLLIFLYTVILYIKSIKYTKYSIYPNYRNSKKRCHYGYMYVLLRKEFWHNTVEFTGVQGKLLNENLNKLYCSKNTPGLIKPTKMRLEECNSYRRNKKFIQILVRDSEGKGLHRRDNCR